MEIPIKKPSAPLEQAVPQRVTRIQEAKKHSQDTAADEKQIDLLLYKFYDLTHEEVLVTDPEFGIRPSEYEHVSLPA